MSNTHLEKTSELSINFQKRGGLVPVVAQDASDGLVLMVGYANPEALQKTIELGYATFYSTSRQEIWTKGLTSGDKLKVINILADCDQDALIYQVERQGSGACHTKNTEGKARKSCFYRTYSAQDNILQFIEE